MGFQIQIWPILLVFLVDFGKVLCSSANELQENSNASSREDYIPQILAVLFEILPPGGGGGGYSHPLPIRVCAAQRGRDFEAPDLERGTYFRGVF